MNINYHFDDSNTTRQNITRIILSNRLTNIIATIINYTLKIP